MRRLRAFLAKWAGAREAVSAAARLDGKVQRISAITGERAFLVDREIRRRRWAGAGPTLLDVADELLREAEAADWP